MDHSARVVTVSLCCGGDHPRSLATATGLGLLGFWSGVGVGVRLPLARSHWSWRHHAAVGGVPLHLAGLGVGDPLALGVLDVARRTRRAGSPRQLRLATDVDAHAGEAGGEAGVLALLADRQAELVVGDDDVGLGAVVGDDDLLDLRRRQRLGDEVGQVLAERDDVDLLAAQLVDDHAHTAAAGADAGADRVDVVVVAPHGDLRAVPWLAGAGLDLDDAVGDLGHLELEQPLDQAGVGAADDDLRALGGLADLDDVGLDAVARLRAARTAPARPAAAAPRPDRGRAACSGWSVCWMMPVTMSPSRLAYSSNLRSRSASRMRWLITWRNVWAAMRPSSSFFGVSSRSLTQLPSSSTS